MDDNGEKVAESEAKVILGCVSARLATDLLSNSRLPSDWFELISMSDTRLDGGDRNDKHGLRLLIAIQ